MDSQPLSAENLGLHLNQIKHAYTLQTALLNENTLKLHAQSRIEEITKLFDTTCEYLQSSSPQLVSQLIPQIKTILPNESTAQKDVLTNLLYLEESLTSYLLQSLLNNYPQSYANKLLKSYVNATLASKFWKKSLRIIIQPTPFPGFTDNSTN